MSVVTTVLRNVVTASADVRIASDLVEAGTQKLESASSTTIMMGTTTVRMNLEGYRAHTQVFAIFARARVFVLFTKLRATEASDRHQTRMGTP